MPVDNLTHQDLLGQTITKPHLEITEATVEERITVPTINPNSQLKNKEMQNLSTVKPLNLIFRSNSECKINNKTKF